MPRRGDEGRGEGVKSGGDGGALGGCWGRGGNPHPSLPCQRGVHPAVAPAFSQHNRGRASPPSPLPSRYPPFSSLIPPPTPHSRGFPARRGARGAAPRRGQGWRGGGRGAERRPPGTRRGRAGVRPEPPLPSAPRRPRGCGSARAAAPALWAAGEAEPSGECGYRGARGGASRAVPGQAEPRGEPHVGTGGGRASTGVLPAGARLCPQPHPGSFRGCEAPPVGGGGRGLGTEGGGGVGGSLVCGGLNALGCAESCRCLWQPPAGTCPPPASALGPCAPEAPVPAASPRCQGWREPLAAPRSLSLADLSRPPGLRKGRPHLLLLLFPPRVLLATPGPCPSPLSASSILGLGVFSCQKSQA